MKPSTLAVVIPNYNHARYLPEAIESILAQTRRPDEFLILDDASTDHSLEVIRGYAARHPWIQVLALEANQGVNAAHRRLFEAVRSDYVIPLAADDYRYPHCCERAMEMAARYPEAGLIIGQMVMMAGGREAGRFGVSAWQEPTFASPERYLKECLLREPPSHSLTAATVFRTAPFREAGWYCESLGPWGDTFTAQAIGLKYGVCYVPEPFAQWRKEEGSYSQAREGNPQEKLQLIHEAARRMRSPPFRDRFPEAYVRTWRRRFVWRVVKEYWRGDHGGLPPGSSLVRRYRYRLPRTWKALRLWWGAGRPARRRPDSGSGGTG